ncbi:MAG: N-acetylglucosamine-6-phosphate deacetylase [Hyphomonadaceae bacterium]|nr:N-acetylglucosamine-6-phosphate deacetylase [Hyphomonadaceae bacterium]
MQALSPKLLCTGDEIIEGATVHIDGGRILTVASTPAPGATKLEGLLAPGYIDIQVNGGGGVLFNDAPTLQTLQTIAAAHRPFGVTGFMATLISDDRSKAARAIEAVEHALKSGVEGLLGLHLEGPWLSDPRRGVHPSKFLRQLDAEDIQLLTRKRSFPLLITVAPEQIDAASLKTLAAAGVKISLGHTAASSENVEAALAAGATGFTHLFNAMPPLEGRNPGPVGAALANRSVWTGLILDGIHVHPTSARVAFAAKTANKLILVSDAMSTIGSKDPSMSLFGEKITVRDGALRTANGTLAGAHLELSTAVRNAVSLLGATQQEALRMATLTPAEFLGVDKDRGRIAPGARADFVLLGPTLDLKEIWIAGKRIS